MDILSISRAVLGAAFAAFLVGCGGGGGGNGQPSAPTNRAVGTPVDADAASNLVAETAAAGSAVGVTVQANDPDSGDTVTYSLANAANLPFSIEAATGRITLNGSVDFETRNSYDLVVTARSRDGTESSLTLTINIGDVIEPAPVSAVTDADAAADLVAENATLGTPVGVRANATDPNTGDTVTYTLSNDGGGLFAIGATTGVITLIGSLDFEAQASHAMSVLATSSDGSISSGNFTISVGDVADNLVISAAVDTDAKANSVPENAPVAWPTGVRVAATDANPTDTVSYSLTDDAGGRFAIHASLGYVTVNGQLDFETASTHAISVRALSSDGSQSTLDLDIAVRDIDEPRPDAIATLAAGGRHSCAISHVGKVKCWGQNVSGQVGVSGVGSQQAAVAVAGLATTRLATHAGAIAAGNTHTCAIVAERGTVVCWGSNIVGQLGNAGASLSGPDPVVVRNLSGVTALSAAGEETCAIVGAGEYGRLSCWGSVVVTNPTFIDAREIYRSPTPAILPGSVAVAVGEFHLCLLQQSVRCWGQTSGYTMGSPDVNTVTAGPGAPITAFAGEALAIAAGQRSSCVIARASQGDDFVGPVRCWGSNGDGLLGDTDFHLSTHEAVPVRMPGGAELSASHITIGEQHACSIGSDSKVRCWGSAFYEQLGGLAAEHQGGARLVPGIETVDFTSIAAGKFHTCAVTAIGGYAVCWGANDFGQLGRPIGLSLPVGPVANL